MNTVEWVGVYYQCEFAVNTSFDAIRHIKIEPISGAYKMLSDYSIQGAAMVNKSCLGNETLEIPYRRPKFLKFSGGH